MNLIAKLANNKLVKETTKHGGQVIGFLSKNSPTILTGCAVVCACGAVALAIKATFESNDDIYEAKKKKLQEMIILNGDEGIDADEKEELIQNVELNKAEIVVAIWKNYIPTGIALVGTAACVIGAHGIDAKRTAAMAALYQVSEAALKDQLSATKEVVGEKKAKEIQEKVAETAIAKCPPPPDDHIFNQGGGVVRCYDCISGRYFWSDANQINAAVNALNAQMINGDDRVSVNDWYYAIGLPGTAYDDERGWNVDCRINVQFTSSLTSDATPILAIGHNNPPFQWYRDCY